MANTYASLHHHIVFSTKNRERWIAPDVEDRLWAYLGGIAKENHVTPLQIGGTEDHVHMLLGAPATIAPARIAQLVKGGSSAWIHETFPRQVCSIAIEFKKFFMDEWNGDADLDEVSRIYDALRSTLPGVEEELERL